jgi:VWFA-related protein
MRRIAALLLFLFVLTCMPGALHAQSGRTRNDPTRIGNDPGSTNPAGGDAVGAPEGDAGGEVVEGDVIRVATTLVTVPVSVMDRDGKYAPDLGRGDFRVFEEGIEQRIAYFATVDQPFTVALLLDTSRSTNFRLEDIQDAAIAFVNQLKPEDRVMVISFDDSINVLAKPTNDRRELTRAIRRTSTGGGTRLYDAVDLVINKHLKQITGRKAVVLFTDGVDTTSHRASYDSTLRDAEELDALIYPVAYESEDGGGLGGGGQRIPLPGGRGGIILGLPFPRMPMPGPGGGRGGSTRGGNPRADAYLHELARKTGGRYYRGDTMMGLSQAFAWIADELRRQYSLGYYPNPPGQEGQRRQIKVRVNRSNLVVAARDSYIYSQKKTGGAATDEQQSSEPAAKGNQLGGTR